jgi:hypothetical protein
VTLNEAKKKLERAARGDYEQYSAAFKLALLKLLDHASELELALADIRRDAIGQPDSTFVARARSRIDNVLADVEMRIDGVDDEETSPDKLFEMYRSEYLEFRERLKPHSSSDTRSEKMWATLDVLLSNPGPLE